MITCYLQYELDPEKIDEFEEYARLWLALLPKFGGEHHGYFLPHESANDLAVALFSFPSLAADQVQSTQIHTPTSAPTKCDATQIHTPTPAPTKCDATLTHIGLSL